MCNSNLLFNSLTTNKFLQYSFILTIIQIIIISLIILFTILCFISCNLSFIIKTGYSYYINNIFFGLIILSIIILIIFYQKKKILIKDKKQASIFFYMICISISITKSFTSFVTIGKLRNLYSLIKKWNLTYQISYAKMYKEYNILFAYLIILLGLYLIYGLFCLIHIILISKLRVIILNNNLNNDYYNNNNNLSHLSTKPDFDDNSHEIIINNLNEGNKNNNFYFLSQNIINKIKKEYEDKGTQTNIKGIIK